MRLLKQMPSAGVAVVLLCVACGAGEEADAPPESVDQTTIETTSTESAETSPEQTQQATTNSTVATTSALDAGTMLVLGPPSRVEGTPLDSPAAASKDGVVVVRATAQEEGIEAGTEVWFSSNGSTWDVAQRITGARLRSVAAAGPGFVAVGQADSGDLGPQTPAGRLPEPIPAVWTSEDGRIWTAAQTVDHEPFDYGRMTDIVAGAAGIVAVGEVWDAAGTIRPAVWSSEAGAVWTLLPGNPLGVTDDRVSMQVAAGEGGIVAIGQLTPVDGDAPGPMLAWWSENGVQWERAPDIPSVAADPPLLGDLLAFQSGFVLVGSRGAQIPFVWFSADGRTWAEPAPLPTRPETGSSIVNALASDGSILVAVGDDVIFGEGTGPATGDASVWTSTDAVQWTQIPPEQLRGDAVLDVAAATSAVRLDGDWILLGTTWDRTEENRAGLVWFER